MGCSRPVTGLTTPRCGLLLFQNVHVSGGGESFVLVFVTSLTDVGADIFRRVSVFRAVRRLLTEETQPEDSDKTKCQASKAQNR